MQAPAELHRKKVVLGPALGLIEPLQIFFAKRGITLTGWDT
jgi:hypothetical protein